MNRVIKFRAWNEIDKSMDLHAHQRAWFGSQAENSIYDYLKLMQYTGLKDRNGKEIYECDIFTLTPHDDKSNPNVVKWEHSGYHMPNSDVMEVIGNIYETPELLDA